MREEICPRLCKAVTELRNKAGSLEVCLSVLLLRPSSLSLVQSSSVTE